MRKFFLFIAAMCCAGMVSAQEIATWSGFRTAAASFTFDDGAPSHITDGAPLFEQYGYRATFFLVSNWNPDWEGFQALADNGHEIGSHSKSHGMNMTGEEQSSKDSINAHISGHDCLTVGYPNCGIPTDLSVVAANYIAGRTCFSAEDPIMGKNGPADWYKVNCILTGSNGNNEAQSANGFINILKQTVAKSGMVVFMTHGFTGKNNGNATYSPTDIGAIDGVLQWANQNDKSIWITPFCNAVMYAKERMASSFIEKARNASGVTYSLTHDIADAVCSYQFPLSLRIPDEDRASVAVKQGTKTLESKIENGFIYFDAVPNDGDIVVTSSEAISNVSAKHSANKRIEAGQLLIERNGKAFNALGAEIK